MLNTLGEIIKEKFNIEIIEKLIILGNAHNVHTCMYAHTCMWYELNVIDGPP